MTNTAFKLGVMASSATLADFGADIKTGQTRYFSGNYYVLVRADEAVADGYACAVDISGTTAVGEISVSLSGTGASVICWNNTGATVASGSYFWGIISGIGYGYATSGHTLTAGDKLQTSSTAGEMDDHSAGEVCGFSLEIPTAGALFDMFCTGVITAQQS